MQRLPAARAASESSASRTAWSAPAAQRVAVVLVADDVGHVLDQRAAGGDVHHLHAAADAEQRQVALERAAAERHLEGVALGVLADVDAAGEHEAVDAVQHLVGMLGRDGVRGEQQRRAPPARWTART